MMELSRDCGSIMIQTSWSFHDHDESRLLQASHKAFKFYIFFIIIVCNLDNNGSIDKKCVRKQRHICLIKMKRSLHCVQVSFPTSYLLDIPFVRLLTIEMLDKFFFGCQIFYMSNNNDAQYPNCLTQRFLRHYTHSLIF